MNNICVALVETRMTDVGDVEIIEFTRPFEAEKNVYVTRLPEGACEVDLLEFLYGRFSSYGLIYDINLYPGSGNISAKKEEEGEQEACPSYGFVNFYSSRAAKMAIQDLTGRLFFKGSFIKLQNRRTTPPIQPLYFTKCYDLAHHYLGYNGFSIAVDKVFDECDSERPNVVKFVTKVTLTLHQHDLDTYGFGEAEEKFNILEPSTKSVAYCKAKKLSYSVAVANAFLKVVLVLLPDGKLHVEINTTTVDLLYREMNMEPLLQVNELEESPGEESDDEAAGFAGMEDTLDEINVDILAELGS